MTPRQHTASSPDVAGNQPPHQTSPDEDHLRQRRDLNVAGTDDFVAATLGATDGRGVDAILGWNGVAAWSR
jgi:hypothetical protein